MSKKGDVLVRVGAERRRNLEVVDCASLSGRFSTVPAVNHIARRLLELSRAYVRSSLETKSEMFARDLLEDHSQ